ncbi:hypothetical protein ACIOK4_13655 [Streptomyces bottropensis]|uniref:hypothetical protein n=1 Tax=Streptomyces bottropensis TaxID=42235 RepID=UPI003830DE6F
MEQTVTANPNPDPTAVWIDGDPLMEAIAAAVWERCGRDDVDMPQLTMDDPRTIAAAAASVARQQAAVSVVPPATNQTALLSGAERQFLTFALDLAFDRMVSDDGFTDEDEAALAKLRRLAAEAPHAETPDAPAVVAQPGKETQT